MKTKIEEFCARSRYRNPHLYTDSAVCGQDYVVCPVSNARMLIIRTDYITNVLSMTVEEYDRLYPHVQKRCVAHQNNIRAGIQKIDPETGLTKYQLSQRKAQQKLSAVDANGVSGYKRKGQKTRATHMNKVDELGRNGYQRQANYRLTTVLENGLTVEENAHIKQKETLISNNKTGSGGASKQSKRVLSPIIDLLLQNNIKFYFDSTEYGIKDPKTGLYYFYDLTIPDFKITFEYQSSAWHADPRLTEDEWAKWCPPRGKKKTPEEVLQYDYDKARSLYKNRGITTYYVWQKTEKQDIEDGLCLLKTLITKF
jgi:hypothetical protein